MTKLGVAASRGAELRATMCSGTDRLTGIFGVHAEEHQHEQGVDAEADLKCEARRRPECIALAKHRLGRLLFSFPPRHRAGPSFS